MKSLIRIKIRCDHLDQNGGGVMLIFDPMVVHVNTFSVLCEPPDHDKGG